MNSKQTTRRVYWSQRLLPILLLLLSLGTGTVLRPQLIGATEATVTDRGPSQSPSPSRSPEPSGSPRPSGSPEASGSPEPSESPEPSGSPRASGSPSPSTSPRPSTSPSPSTSPRPSSGFDDVGDDHPERQAIGYVSEHGIVKGYGDGNFGPDDHTLRAQMAAMIARTVGWDLEDHGNRFGDRCDNKANCIDDDLWRNIGTLAEHGVARGYEDGTYAPFNEVSQVQTISFITRAMVAAGRWTPVTVDDPTIYANVTLASGHRLDLLTYIHYAGAIPNQPLTAPWAAWNQPATRAWFAQALYQAVTVK